MPRACWTATLGTRASVRARGGACKLSRFAYDMRVTRQSARQQGPEGTARSRPSQSPPRRRPDEAAPPHVEGAGALGEDQPRCLVCLMAGAGATTRACGHHVCSRCFKEYIHHRINERAVLDMACPGAHDCPLKVSRAEVGAVVLPATLERYDAFVLLERAERDPHTRWCVRPECGNVCAPCVSEAPFSRPATVCGVLLSAGAAALPLLARDLCAPLGLEPEVTSAAVACGAVGLLAALWHGARRLSPHRRCACPTCGTSVCYDCKAAWHPGSMCEEVSAQSLVRWCRVRDAGQCPQCGVFIERRAGCNHMDCRCGHSFCWLCLQPLHRHCGCPQFGGRRTADARARLSSPGWRRAVLLAGDAASLRLLALSLGVGLILHRTDDLLDVAVAAWALLCSSSLATRLLLGQVACGLVQLAVARDAMQRLPRRIAHHLSVRQVDLSLGGAGTGMVLACLRALERLHMLPPRPPPPPPPAAGGSAYGGRWRGRIREALAAAAAAALRLDGRHQNGRAPPLWEADALVRLRPSVVDLHPLAPRPPRPGGGGASQTRHHSDRPFALRTNHTGYVLSRRRRAALPTVAAAAFAVEVVLLPAFAPLLLVAGLHLGCGGVLWAAGGLSSLLVDLDALLSAAALTRGSLSLAAALTCLRLPAMLSYAFAVACTVLVLGATTALAFFGCVTVLICLLSSLRETGLRRRVAARLHADPEADLDEIIDDGEVSRSHAPARRPHRPRACLCRPSPPPPRLAP